MEKRLDQRRRVLKAATISFGGGGGISCAVRNLSASGALLEVTSPLGFPDQFILHLEHSTRRCSVIWRKENRVGVSFEL